MLINAEQIHAATSLTRMLLGQVLKSSGYPGASGDIKSSAFLGLNQDSQFVYEITFPGGRGKVYVFYQYNENGKLVLAADF